MKKSISSKNAPKAADYFSQAVLSDEKQVLELSGQIGLDPKTFKLVEGGVQAQTERAFQNIEAVLAAAGMTLTNVTKVRVYLTSMSDYQEMNDVYAEKFGDTPPARVTLSVKELPMGALVEIECVARTA